METLANAVDALRGELNARVYPAAKWKTTLQLSNGGSLDLLSFEPSRRPHVDKYMLRWSSNPVWVEAEPLILLLAYYRLEEGTHFGEWLLQSVPGNPFGLVEIEVQIWFSWLLIDHWNANGHLRWVSRQRDGRQ